MAAYQILLLLFIFVVSAALSAAFTPTNYCNHIDWPSMVSKAMERVIERMLEKVIVWTTEKFYEMFREELVERDTEDSREMNLHVTSHEVDGVYMFG